MIIGIPDVTQTTVARVVGVRAWHGPQLLAELFRRGQIPACAGLAPSCHDPVVAAIMTAPIPERVPGDEACFDKFVQLVQVNV